MNVGDYVRTIDGDIAKVEDIDEGLIYVDKIVSSKRDLFVKLAILLSDEINKSSPSIIDLIQVRRLCEWEENIRKKGKCIFRSIIK